MHSKNESILDFKKKHKMTKKHFFFQTTEPDDSFFKK